MIELRNLSRFYGEEPGVQEVNMNVERGTGVGVVGPNGAGKSTLLKLIAGHLHPTTGSVLLDGHDIHTQSADRAEIGFSGHEPMVYEPLTARENLKHYGTLYGMKTPELEKAVRDRLDQVGLSGRAGDRVGSFSSGMKKRLSLARALLHSPRVLVLDEPYRGLDREAIETIQSVLAEERSGGRILFLASHDLRRVYETVDEICMVNRTRPTWQKQTGTHSFEDISADYRRVTGQEISVHQA